LRLPMVKWIWSIAIWFAVRQYLNRKKTAKHCQTPADHGLFSMGIVPISRTQSEIQGPSRWTPAEKIHPGSSACLALHQLLGPQRLGCFMIWMSKLWYQLTEFTCYITLFTTLTILMIVFLSLPPQIKTASEPFYMQTW
jgi:hypothetical protein